MSAFGIQQQLQQIAQQLGDIQQQVNNIQQQVQVLQARYAEFLYLLYSSSSRLLPIGRICCLCSLKMQQLPGKHPSIILLTL
jgi:hypothetical protein